MRNILVHGYFAIDLEEVWVTVEQRVPVLQNQIETILRGDTGPRTVAERRPGRAGRRCAPAPRAPGPSPSVAPLIGSP